MTFWVKVLNKECTDIKCNKPIYMQDVYNMGFHTIPKMTSHRLSVVKFETKISRYF